MTLKIFQILTLVRPSSHRRMIRSSLIIFSPLGRSSLHPRSPSPPIKSHYRNFVQVRVPSRPLTASGNQQRLSDLTELRQLYSNR